MTCETIQGSSDEWCERRRQTEAIDSDERYGPVCKAEVYKKSEEVEAGCPKEMGVRIKGDGCNVAIWAGTAEFVDVCIFDPNDHNKTLGRWRLQKDENGVFCGYIPDMSAGGIYGFRVHGEWNPADRKFYNYNKLLTDPYALAMTGSFRAVLEDGSQNPAVNEPVDDKGNYLGPKEKADSAPYVPRSIVVDRSYDWEGVEKPVIPEGKRVTYEAHVKGLTQLCPGVPAELRGTYAGMGHPFIINYLKDHLGITSLELLPPQQSASEPHLQAKGLINYWGYQTIGFFAPHDKYSSNKEPGGQVKEFKDMVKSLHEAGIEVILDVVYNHTPESEEKGPTLMFQGLDPEGYYHLSGDGKHTNYSGCGNTMNVSTDVGMKLTLDSLRYWAEEMDVDGFRFDLASILARGWGGNIDMQGRFMTALANDPVLNKLLIIAEPWDCGDGYRVGGFPKPLWKEWNGKFRDILRNFLRGEGNAPDLRKALARGAGCMPPNSSVNFITAHDGFTLADLVAYNEKRNKANGEDNGDGDNDNHSWNREVEGPTDDEEINKLRERVMRSFLLSMFISAGTPMLSHGDEIMRTQGGNNNAYCQDNEISWVDWNLSDQQKEFLKYVTNIIGFRKSHEIFNGLSPLDEQPVLDLGNIKVENRIAWFGGDGNEFPENGAEWQKVIGWYMSGISLKAQDESGVEITVEDDCILYYANGTNEEQTITLPNSHPYNGDYEIVIDTAPEDDRTVMDNNTLVLGPFDSVVLKRVSCRLPNQIAA